MKARLVPALVVVALSVSHAAIAHEDAPGPPNLQVKAIVTGATVVPSAPGASINFDPFSDEEMRLVILADHKNMHGQGMVRSEALWDVPAFAGALPFKDSSVGGFGFTTNQSSGDFGSNALDLFWEHEDCTSRDPLLMNVAMVEVDDNTFGVGVLGLIAMAFAIIGVIPGAGIPFAIAGLGISALALGISSDDDEDLGFALNAIPASGAITYTLAGADGGASVTLQGTTIQSPTRPCTMVVSQVPPPVSERAALVYDPLDENLMLASTLSPEAGNPGGFSPEQTAALRTSIERTALRLGAAVAAAVTQEAAGFLGDAAAANQLAAARALDLGGMDTEALAGYRQAFELALGAIDSQEMIPPTYPDRQLFLVTDYLVPRRTADLLIRGVVAGLAPGDSLDDISLFDVTEGMETTVRPGFEKQGLLLEADLSASFTTNQVIGLGRVSGFGVRPPDANCPNPHVEDATLFQTGITIDGQGPFPEPISPCAYGRAVTTQLILPKGSTPIGATFEGGRFTLDLSLTDVQPGTYELEAVASITPSGGGFMEVSAPLTLVVVPEPTTMVGLLAGLFALLLLKRPPPGRRTRTRNVRTPLEEN